MYLSLPITRELHVPELCEDDTVEFPLIYMVLVSKTWRGPLGSVLTVVRVRHRTGSNQRSKHHLFSHNVIPNPFSNRSLFASIIFVGNLAMYCWSTSHAMKYKDCMRDFINQMTLEEKIGQKTQIDRSVATADIMRKYLLGSSFRCRS